MVPMMRPPSVKPARFMFDSDAAFELAMKAYHREMKERRAADAWNEAGMIVVAAMFLAAAVWALGFIAYLAGGWRGIGYLFAGCGLIWAAIVEVHKRISGEAR